MFDMSDRLQAFTESLAYTLGCCEGGDHVKRPGSARICAGNQCCPGQDGGPTFTCPSATAWNGLCESDVKVESCLPCCRAMTAECLACDAGMSEEQYCNMSPQTAGCEAKACCLAMIAECLS